MLDSLYFILIKDCNAVDKYGKKEAGTGEHLNTFNQINKHKWNAAAPRGRLPHTKHKVKSRPGPLSSSTVVTPHFIPSEAPPWDSRPVSGAGVVHYHSLHRPRSVPTALGPAPLVTRTNCVVKLAMLELMCFVCVCMCMCVHAPARSLQLFPYTSRINFKHLLSY